MLSFRGCLGTMAAPAKPGSQVVDVNGPLPARLVLEKEVEVVGRSSDCSICVRSVMVSRRHAVFSRDLSGLWKVADDSSMNGVYVNSQRVDPERPQTLRPDDVISFGPPQRTNLIFRFVTDEVATTQQGVGQCSGDAPAVPRAFLLMISGGASHPPKGPDAAGMFGLLRERSRAADDSESDGSPVFPSDKANNNLAPESGPLTPNGCAAAGPSYTCAKNTKKIRLSAGDSVVRKVESIMENELTCAICSELFVDAAMLQCGHTFCSYCIHNWQKQKNSCPFCLVTISSITRSFVVDNIINELVDFNPELKQFRESIARSRVAASHRSHRGAAKN